MTIVESSTPPEELATELVAQHTQDTDMLAGAKETRQLDLSGAALSIGDRIGNYIVERVIGSGGMGLVVAARHEGLNELVAIKVLRPKAASDEVHAERFAREARAIVKIKSEHVVRVLDAAAPEGGAPFIVMEYLVGRDLARILKEEGRIPVVQAAAMMLQICEAVASAHAVGVIHRDLKPSNFFVTTRADGEPLVKVLDFGISKAIGQDGLVDPNLTETQAVFGSPTYMSPEQIRSAKHVDQRSDIWSLGVGFYEILTGKLPFAADNVAGLLASIVADPPFYPRGFVPELPEELELLLLQCLAKDARERVQSVAELAFRIAPFAPRSAANHDLVDRIDRLAAASSPHAMTGAATARAPAGARPADLVSGRGLRAGLRRHAGQHRQHELRQHRDGPFRRGGGAPATWRGRRCRGRRRDRRRSPGPRRRRRGLRARDAPEGDGQRRAVGVRDHPRPVGERAFTRGFPRVERVEHVGHAFARSSARRVGQRAEARDKTGPSSLAPDPAPRSDEVGRSDERSLLGSSTEK